MQIQDLDLSFQGHPTVRAVLEQTSAVAFEPDVQIQVLDNREENLIHASHFSEAGFPVAWLPRGTYDLECHLHDIRLPAGDYRLRMIVSCMERGERRAVTEHTRVVSSPAEVSAGGLSQASWSIRSAPGTVAVEELAWNRGHEDWFFRHFDHAALVVGDYLLKYHPMLRGRVLDVGCGDGIIDLGIFLRMQPRELVGIDPCSGFDRLPEVITANHLPLDVLDDERLKFRNDDGNAIPYPDDYFDVVVSWGSLEHIAGGYGPALLEIRRVLKNGGLLFVHPGLYYGALGNHLGEFFDDPFIHLKRQEADLKDAVLSTRPQRMDRAGHVATPEEYWQWYTELNPIRVGPFEQELRELGFEPWRAAVRTSDIIEYTDELQAHSIQDLATSELYLSAWNRK